MIPVRRLFFEWRYLTRVAPWDTGVSPPELIAFLEDHQPGAAIDLGCGTGTNALTMAQYGWQVLGADISLLAIWMARRKARRAGLTAEFVRANVAHLPGIEGPFDFALDIGCFHSLPPAAKARYVAAIARRLRPGAHYLLYSWVRERSDDPAHAPTRQAIEELFSPNMRLVDVKLGEERSRTSAWYHWQVKGA